MSICSELLDLVCDCRPMSILTSGLESEQVGAAWTDIAGLSMDSNASCRSWTLVGLEQQFDLALITDWPEIRPSASQLSAWLGTLRNQFAKRVILVTPQDDVLRPLSFYLALGFTRYREFDTGRSLYTYDLAHYNRPRSWNNPRYWANPQNWGKYWW